MVPCVRSAYRTPTCACARFSFVPGVDQVDQVHSQLPCPLLPLSPSLPLSLPLSHNSTTGYPQGKTVLVKTNSGSDFKGILHCLDGFLNIALEHCEEWSNGECRRTYGDAFIRGNNVTFISLIGK